LKGSGPLTAMKVADIISLKHQGDSFYGSLCITSSVTQAILIK